MASNTLQYLKFDFESHRSALLQRIRDRYPARWNDFLSNSIGVVIVDIVAYSIASAAYLINRVAGENFIGTMTVRESAVRMGGLTGYNLRGPVPASVSCEASIPSPVAADVTIAQGTLVRTSDSAAIPFEVAQDYLITAGSLTPRRLVLSLSPDLNGAGVVNSFVRLTAGSVNVDLVDTTVDLSAFIESGQSFNQRGAADVYTIVALEKAPGSTADFTRLVLDRAWEGDSGTVEGEVYDQRIALSQGQTVVDRFVVAASDTQRYTATLSRGPVIDGSVQALVNGERWEQAGQSDFRDAEERVFQVKTLVSGSVLVIFGDDNFGAAVPADAAVQITYRIGGGAAGNIALNSISTSVTGLIASLNNPVPVTITNTSSTGQGGRDAETLEEARNNIPVYARTNNRAVTLGDYQTLASLYSGPTGSIAYARAAVRLENSFLEGNLVAIYAWTTGTAGGLVNLGVPLRTSLKDYLRTKAVGTDLVEVFDGTSRPVPVSLRFKTLGGFSVSDTRTLVSSTLRNFINALRPGDPVQFSDLLRALDEVDGVDNVDMATPLGDLIPSNDTELFTAPQDTFEYEIGRTGFGSPVTDSTGALISSYTAQLPVYPLQAWAFEMFMGSAVVTIMPDSLPGFARLLGDNLSDDDAFPSIVNLLTGEASLWIKGAPGDLTMKLVSVSGYAQDRAVNVYVGYAGENTVTKRRQIRAALRSWSSGLGVGGAVYASRVPGISASRVSITDVIEAVDGVDRVTRVALDSPANNASRINAADTELIRIGNCVLNNFSD